jgi:hypothetical protein
MLHYGGLFMGVHLYCYGNCPGPKMAATREVPTKSFVIKDPVHGYLRIAAHERIIVDHPITQRLHRITQTGLAEFVFPEA